MLSSRQLILSLLGVCALAMASGCTTSMTSMTNARAQEPLEVQVTANMQATVHANIVSAAARSADSAIETFGDREEGEPITEEAFRDWLDLALTAALFRPATSPEVIARVGVTDKVMEGIDVGFRTNLSIFKGDLKLQLWENEAQNQALSVMVGYAYHRDWVNKWVSYLTLTDFKRFDLDAQVLWGMEFGKFARVNVAPHLIASRIKVEQKLPAQIANRLPDEVKRYDPNQLFEDEWMFYMGANTSFMVGYEYVFVALDLGAFWLNFKPTVVGEQRDYSGAALSIAGGLSFNYAF